MTNTTEAETTEDTPSELRKTKTPTVDLLIKDLTYEQAEKITTYLNGDSEMLRS